MPIALRPDPARIALATFLLGAAATAFAQEERAFSFSGYGTLGVAHSDNDRADYLVDAFRPSGPGFTHDWSADVDSRLGAQVTASLGSRVSAVVQVLSHQAYDDSYRPMVEWANVKLQATPDIAVRAGRVVLPIFLETDSRRVGYANPWVRPPVEVYSLVPVTTSDGVDGSWRMQPGDWVNTVQVTLGRSDSHFPDSGGFKAGTAKVRNELAVVDTLERGFATLRLSYGQARLTVDALQPLFDAYRQFGPTGEALAQRFEVSDRLVHFSGVGASYDPGRWFAMAEWARFDTDSLLGVKSGWYASGGWRFGRLTPYATYARVKADSDTSNPGLPTQGLPPPLAGLAGQLNAALNNELGLIPQQHTVSLGLRWDALRNAAFKLQYDRVAVAASSYGTFGNIQPGFHRGETVDVFSAVVDFVF